MKFASEPKCSRFFRARDFFHSFPLYILSLRLPEDPGDGNARFDGAPALPPSSVVYEEVMLKGNLGAFHIVKPVWLLIPVKNRWVAPR